MSYSLKILSSPDQKQPGIKFDLAEGDTLLGRLSPPAQIALAGTKVSKKHCVIKQSNGSLRIEDLKSSNGVFVNGKQVESAKLENGDRLVIGEFILEVVAKAGK